MIYVIGANVAGLRFANYLSELSLDFHVFDKKPEIIGEQGDYIVLNNSFLEKYDFKRMGNSALVNDVEVVRFHSPYGKIAEIETHGAYSIYDKSTLEYLLYKKLQNKGKDLVHSARFFDYNKTNGNVFFEEKGKGTLRKADVIVGCDGLYSNVRDKLFNYSLAKKKMVYCRLKGKFDPKAIDYFVSNECKSLYRFVCPLDNKTAYFVSSEMSKESIDEFVLKNNYVVDGEIKYKEIGNFNGKKNLVGDQALLLGSAGGVFNNFSGENFFESLRSVDIGYEIMRNTIKKTKYGSKDKFNFNRQNFLFDSLFNTLDQKAKKRSSLESLSEHKLDKLVARLNKKKASLVMPYPFEMVDNGFKKSFLFF
jgi:flavin-dependent dehydrogenase